MDCITCIDIGNQFLKFAEFDSYGNIIQEGNKPNSELKSILNAQDNIFIISDVAKKTQAFESNSNTHILNHQFKFPFQIDYKSPETLGLDRLCGLSGAKFLQPNAENYLVFSLGTCLTIDFLGKENVYHGGAISPGMSIRYKALNHYTAALPLLDFLEMESVSGNDTQSSIHCGVQNGILAEILFYIEHYQNKADMLSVFMSGGDALHFVNKTKSKIFAAPNLNLYGLFHIAKINELI